MSHPDRRAFITTLGVGAALATARPVFAAERSFPREAKQSGDVLLNFNESPYGPSPRALEAFRTATGTTIGRYHPEWTYESLCDAIASHHGVTRAHVRVAAGSTEILKTCDDVFLAGGKGVVVAEPAYEAVLQYAANSRARAVSIALTPDHRHDLVAMARATDASTGLVYVCNPNNPTGTIVRRGELATFMAAMPASATVLVDEAYAEFVGDPEFESAVRYVKAGANVVVAKTFSKIHGLAGARVGYAVARPELIERLVPHTVDFDVSSASANAALASLRDTAHTADVARRNAAERSRFVAEMRRLGLACAEPHGNFVMVDLKRPAAAVIERLAAARVKVGREFKAMPTFLRVTLGTAREMDAFYAAFRQVI